MHQRLPGKIEKAIRQENIFLPGDRVLAAVSGGPDSCALLHILFELKDACGFELEAAHLNHGLRGHESDDDERFTEEFAGKLNIHLATEKADIARTASERQISIEEAARCVRYSFLERVSAERKLNKIALGHTLDDQVETVLHNFLRGAALRGLSGMLPVQGKFVRPLLGERRETLLDYLREKGIPWRIDSSNLDPHFTRNRIRHKLIPFLEKEFNPGLRETLSRNSKVLGEIDGYLSAEAEKLFSTVGKHEGNRITLDLRSLLQYDRALVAYSIAHGLCRLKGDLQEISSKHLASLSRLAFELPTGSLVVLPQGLAAQKTSDLIEIFFDDGRREEGPREEKAEKELTIPGTTEIRWAHLSLVANLANGRDLSSQETRGETCAFFDFDSLELPILARARRSGDRFQPFGMETGTKKVKEAMIEKKIPRSERKKVPIVCDKRGILWVVGVARGNLSRVEPGTKRILTIEAAEGRGTVDSNPEKRTF
ncbi:MAG: tRNA lysidine(34) synthetase TilS [Candidatus Eisenbacteria bacterium]|nr:tRNA lysidine(34) synthetase TilS [Candidatus Eisenbacteria bacterium]